MSATPLGSGTTLGRLTGLAFGVQCLVAMAGLVQYWGANPGYADRFLILLGSGWAAYHSWQSTQHLEKRSRSVLGLLLIVVGSVSFALGAFLLPQIGARTLLLWWLFAAGVTQGTGLLLAWGGFPTVRAFLFPLLFLFFALPIPQRVLNPLQDFLQEVTTALSYQLLSAIGYRISRTGFVLDLPGGLLGVEEACSGVRSITALTAIAAFLAYFKGFWAIRGTTLVVCSIPVVAIANVFRVTISGVIQEQIGRDYVQGDWHEALGFAAVLLGLGTIVAMARFFGQREPLREPTTAPNISNVTSPRWPMRASLIGSLIVLSSTLYGFSISQIAASSAPLEQIPLELNRWNGTDQPIPREVTELLRPDVALHRRYETNLGRTAEVWAFHWATGSAIKGYHHPDVCWQKKGYDAAEVWIEPLEIECAPVPVTAREFRGDTGRMLVFYWTQEGPRIWSEAEDRAAENDMIASSWFGHRWVTALLNPDRSIENSRLSVVIVIPGSGPATRRDARQLTESFARELYRHCPWAMPVK